MIIYNKALLINAFHKSLEIIILESMKKEIIKRQLIKMKQLSIIGYVIR